MGLETLISWTDHTWNPWRGCSKVSPGCAHCYAERGMKRLGFDFNQITRTKTWGDPLTWQKSAATRGVIEKVFVCSWSDFNHPGADAWRGEAWALIRNSPNLIYQILTKRDELIRQNLPADWGSGYPNVWLGVSLENENYLHRVETLRRIPAVARFISGEPLLGPLPNLDLTGIHQLIIGGESGPDFRDMLDNWVRPLRDKCQREGVAFFFKQHAAPRTEMGTSFEGREYREFPKLEPVAVS